MTRGAEGTSAEDTASAGMHPLLSLEITVLSANETLDDTVDESYTFEMAPASIGAVALSPAGQRGQQLSGADATAMPRRTALGPRRGAGPPDGGRDREGGTSARRALGVAA